MTATDNYTRTLQQFTLQKIKIVKEAGREKLLGGGSFTSVLELDYNGLKCAGKKVHDWLLKDPSSKSKDMVRRFVEECDFLSQIRHPNIVHFLGFYFQPQVEVPAPILVMEFLPIKLTSCIEQYGILPKEISYTILHDVALGLCYLHSQIPPIIHRNLNSHNVLLTPDMTAKISDLGKAKILMNVQTSSGMTNRPGNDSFMPPEAMVDKPNYDTCIDEFSYGVIMIHMFSGKWPAPQIGQIHVEGDKLIAISEAERREVFLRAIGNDHPLMDLILKCIHNDPQTRAHASEIKERLAEMVMQFPASFANRLEMLRYIEADKKNSESMTEKINLLKSDVEHLQSQVATLTVQNYDLNEKYVLEMNAQDADETAPRTTKTKLDSATGQDSADNATGQTTASRATVPMQNATDGATGHNATGVHINERGKPHDSTDHNDISLGLPGVEVCGKTTIVVTNDQQSFYWEGYGLRLNIPKGSLPKGVEQCTVKILASLAGQYEYPEESHLVSGVFWLQCDPMVKFTKLLSLEIQHCAKAEAVSKLSFVRAVCNQEKLPYTFKYLNPVFSSSSSYGLIKLQRFSGLAITQEGPQDREYIARLFYLNPSISNCDIHLVVTWNIEAHLTDVEKTYHQQQRVLSGPDQPVEFETDQIRLDIPFRGIDLKEGWRLVPLIAPVVTKKHIDSYQPGRRIPRCQLYAEFKPVSTEAKPIPALEYHVQLIGAKEPYNMFTIKPPVQESATNSLRQFSHSNSSEGEKLKISDTSSDSPDYSHQQSDESEKPSLKNILRVLKNTVSTEWENIGIQLDVEDGQLRQIKSNNPGDSKACLRDMLRTWLTRVCPPPSWSQLVEALEIEGYEDIASQIKTKYCI